MAALAVAIIYTSSRSVIEFASAKTYLNSAYSCSTHFVRHVM